MKFSAWYGISVGALIILQWIFFIATGSVPEFQTRPGQLAFIRQQNYCWHLLYLVVASLHCA